MTNTWPFRNYLKKRNNVNKPFFSIIIPVYNRPEEVRELLSSLAQQHYDHFEVIVVEDGSSRTCVKEVEDFKGELNIRYFHQSNKGPGPARNFGFAHAKGDYLISFDSDCVIPVGYLNAVTAFLSNHTVDAWGGPDSGHHTFTALQRAMAYTMSAFLTTGGIRGGSTTLGHFQPRSFNMGLSKKVFETTGGFQFDRYAEDIELSIRIRKAGFKSWLIPDAYVFHKRRETLSGFFRQVKNFGRGRVEVAQAHPGTLRPTHFLPLLFTLGLSLGVLIGMILPLILNLTLLIYGVYLFLIFIGAWKSTQSLAAAILSVPAVLVQLVGYAWGFFLALLRFGQSS